MAKTKTGTTNCNLTDLCFPVELRDNPRNTNRENSKVVTGIVPRIVPYFSEERMAIMKQNFTDEEILVKINSNPATKLIHQETDLNYCSPVYELVPNEMIFPKVEEILNQHGIAFNADYSHTQNTRFYGNFTIEDPRFGYKMAGTNDVIKFIWNFQHSYNGLTKYKGIAGFYRLVCTNGLTIPIQEMKEYNLVVEGKHTSSILKSLEQFSQILLDVTNNLGEVKTSIVNKYEVLGKRWMDANGGNWVEKTNDRIIEVLNANKIAIIDNSNFDTLKSITNAIMSEAQNDGLGYNGRVNDWLIYNGINQYIYDERTIATPEKRRETDSKVLEFMLEYA